MRVFFEMVRLVNLTARPFQTVVGQPYRLTLNEWRVLVVLLQHPGIGAGHVMFHTGLDKMPVSRALRALERQRRIVRIADPADARRSIVRLSIEGERLFARLAAPMRSRGQQLFGEMNRRDLDTLAGLIDRMIASLLAGETSAGPVRPISRTRTVPPLRAAAASAPAPRPRPAGARRNAT